MNLDESALFTKLNECVSLYHEGKLVKKLRFFAMQEIDMRDVNYLDVMTAANYLEDSLKPDLYQHCLRAHSRRGSLPL